MRVSNRNRSWGVALICMAVCLIVASAITFASTITKTSGDGAIHFDKISISADDSITSGGNVVIVAGSKVFDKAVTFEKSVDSRPVYVRASLSFSLTGNGTNEQKAITQNYVNDFNSAEYNVMTTSQNGATWRKDGNFYYLVTYGSTDTFFSITDKYNYTLFSDVTIPTTLTQYTDDPTKLMQVKVEVVIEAIQSEGLPTGYSNIKNKFITTFGNKS